MYGKLSANYNDANENKNISFGYCFLEEKNKKIMMKNEYDMRKFLILRILRNFFIIMKKTHVI